MEKYSSPLHIVSAHIAELGITLVGQKVDDKSNEIPAVRDLIGLLEVEACMIVADAMHCQKETASLVAEKKADYLFNVKDNQSTMKKDIEDYVKDDYLRKTMDTFRTFEKNGGRLEERTGFVTHDIEDEDVQQVLNAVRKIALNCVKTHKQKTNSKFPLSRIMLGCLLDYRKLIPVLLSCEN